MSTNKFVPVYAVKAYWGVRMQLQSFISSALQSKASLPGCPNSQGKRFRYPLKGRLSEIQRRPVGTGEGKILASCRKSEAVVRLWFVRTIPAPTWKHGGKPRHVSEYFAPTQVRRKSVLLQNSQQTRWYLSRWGSKFGLMLASNPFSRQKKVLARKRQATFCCLAY